MTVRLAAAITAAVIACAARADEPGDPGALTSLVISGDRVREQIEAEIAVTPGAVTVIDGESLRERSVTLLSDLFRYVPGVWSESYNGNDDVFFSSRGSNLDATDYDKNGVKFLIDGLPVTAADGNNHNRALDPQNARYVTIAHGANALAYGASTLGGAVDITSPTARTTAPFSAAVTGGSFGQWSARASAGGFNETIDGLVSAETQQRDGYRAHSAQDRRNVYANAGWQVNERVATRFYATWSDYYAELPRELTPAQYASDPWQARADAVSGRQSKDVEAFRLAAKTTIAEVAGGTLEIGASREWQSLYHPIVSLPFFSLLIDTDHVDTGGLLRWKRTAGAHELVVGGNVGHSTINGGNYQNLAGRRGALQWMTNDDASSLELFALDRWRLAPSWTVVYGAQYVDAKRNAGGFAGRYDAVNPRLGVIREAGRGGEWYASVSRVYEAPTTFELQDDASGRATVLDAMHGTAFETGLRGTATTADERRWHWDVSAYYTALRDEILSIDDPRAPGTSLSANVDRTTHAGVEALAGASIPLSERLRLEPLLTATWNAFTFDSDPVYRDNRLPSAPRWFARGELMFGFAGGLRLGPTVDLVGARFVDFANTRRIGGHGLLGARASLRSGAWETFVDARNLLERRYVATVVVKDRVLPGAQFLFPGAPRSLQAGVRYRF